MTSHLRSPSLRHQAPTQDRVVVQTTCDSVTREVRRVLMPIVPLAFAETEAMLHQLVGEGARLIVLHLGGGPEDARTPGRLVRAIPMLRAPIVALTDGAGVFRADLPADGLLQDVLLLKSERWTSLLRAWASYPTSAPYLSEELRLLQQCAPAEVLSLLEDLALSADASLSVKRWSAVAGISRTRLHHRIACSGFTPSHLVDAVRGLHAVGPHLVSRGKLQRSGRAWPVIRAERRVLNRIMGLSPADLVNVGASDPLALRALVSERLRRHFERARKSDRGSLPQAQELRA
ncbi:MAG: hypothetical protein Q8K82_14425 [Gemmatimonadaceae bacterium]|nr:hypothetical protein [Gemmatimonadaceae bacterium]